MRRATSASGEKRLFLRANRVLMLSVSSSDGPEAGKNEACVIQELLTQADGALVVSCPRPARSGDWASESAATKGPGDAWRDSALCPASVFVWSALSLSRVDYCPVPSHAVLWCPLLLSLPPSACAPLVCSPAPAFVRSSSSLAPRLHGHILFEQHSTHPHGRARISRQRELAPPSLAELLTRKECPTILPTPFTRQASRLHLQCCLLLHRICCSTRCSCNSVLVEYL